MKGTLVTYVEDNLTIKIFEQDNIEDVIKDSENEWGRFNEIGFVLI